MIPNWWLMIDRGRDKNQKSWTTHTKPTELSGEIAQHRVDGPEDGAGVDGQGQETGDRLHQADSSLGWNGQQKAELNWANEAQSTTLAVDIAGLKAMFIVVIFRSTFPSPARVESSVTGIQEV